MKIRPAHFALTMFRDRRTDARTEEREKTLYVRPNYVAMCAGMLLGAVQPRYIEAHLILFQQNAYYVAAKATYIRLLHGKIGFLGFFSALAP